MMMGISGWTSQAVCYMLQVKSNLGIDFSKVSAIFGGQLEPLEDDFPLQCPERKFL